MNLVVDPAQHVPSWRSIAELIDCCEPVVANLRREVCEVLNAAAAVCHCAVNLQVKCCVRRFHVVEMGIREDAIPEGSFSLKTQPPDYLEIGIERIQHLTIH